MLHTRIENEEVIERYVRNQLNPDERRTFEEHYFVCEECFARVQEMENFVAGVRDAAERGILTGPAGTSAPFKAGWLPWAFAGSICITALLAIAIGWLTLSTVPKLRSDLNATVARSRSQQQTIAQLQEGAKLPEMPEANVPLAMLQAERGGEASEAVLPVNAKRLLLWVDIGLSHYTSYRIEVFSPSGTLIATIDHLTRSSYGALAISLPANQLQPGIFRVILTGQAPPPASLVGEYRLKIRKP